MAMLLHLCLCLVTVIQLTPSQAVTDVTRQENDVIEVVVNNCGRSDRLLSQLVTSVSRMETAISQQLQDNNTTEQVLSQLVSAVAQLQSDVAELKAGTGHGDEKGKSIQLTRQVEMQQQRSG